MDVDLDGLIKKDKEERKEKRLKKNKEGKFKKGKKEEGGPKKFKTKPIHKGKGDGPRKFSNDAPKDRSDAPKVAKANPKKLKVMGLHPDLKNEELFVLCVSCRNYSLQREHLRSARSTRITSGGP